MARTAVAMFHVPIIFLLEGEEKKERSDQTKKSGQSLPQRGIEKVIRLRWVLYYKSL